MKIQEEIVLIKKLDEFIRKYYTNEIIKGLFYFFALFFTFYLTISILEYFSYFGIFIRSVLFYSFILVNIFILSRYIILPILRFFNLGKQISYDQAAMIIGTHFQHVKDKLLNTLQLSKQFHINQNNDLLLASIQQKTLELQPIPFQQVINLKENKKYLKYVLPPLIVFILLLILVPQVITQSTKRIVYHGTSFTPPAPFQFNILNKQLLVTEGDDFELQVKLVGKTIPDNIYISIGSSEYKLQKKDNFLFSYVFKNPRKNISFQLSGNQFSSSEYELKVVPKPQIISMNLELIYPSYLKMKNEFILNKGDFIVPEGTIVKWKIQTKNVNNILFNQKDSTELFSINNNQFTFKKNVLKNFHYSVLTSNQYIQSTDTLSYTIQVVPDQYPVISVQSKQDSLIPQLLYFSGDIQDDYGLKKLEFRYKRNKDKYTSITVPIYSSLINQTFYYQFDTRQIQINPGDNMEYYFVVWDNDGVNGSKYTQSQLFSVQLPSKVEIEDKISENNEMIKDDLSKSQENLNEFDKAIDQLNKQIAQKKDINWSDKNKLQKLLDKQKEMMENIEKSIELNKNNNLQKQDLTSEEQRILDKQKKLEEMFNQLKDKDLMKLMEELEKEMDKLDKNKLQELMNKYKMENKDLEKELDRTLELFKQLELEQQLNKAIDDLKDLINKQEELSRKNNDKNADSDELKQQQNQLQNEFKQLQDDLKKLEELNNQLENKNDLPETNELEQQVNDQMQNAQDQLKNNDKGKANKSQQSAKQKMQQMQQQLSDAQQSNQNQQAEENIDDLRQILDNLLTLSFDQETAMQLTKTINTNNPQLKDLFKEQKKLIDDSKIIEDSLLALSKRMIELSTFVNKEISDVKTNMSQALKLLTDRQQYASAQKQQYALTAINNLALMLSEALEQLQQQQQQASGTCSKPGQKKPNMSGMMKKQAGLQQKMDQLKQKMDKSGQPKPGEQGEISKELVKMAAEQESIRKELQQMSEGMGKEQKKMINEILKKMEENETDLLNKRINQQTIDRQKEITTRLLESDKATREQEQEQKRQSNEAKDIPNGIKNINPLKELLFKKQTEFFRTITPTLKPYYKTKANEYFNNIK
jgi:hypothetical protein